MGMPLPANTELIADHIAALAIAVSFATINQQVASLNAMHRFRGLSTPAKAIVVKLALLRAGRPLGSAQRQVTPINQRLLKQMLATCEDGLIGARDGAPPLLHWPRNRKTTLGTCRLLSRRRLDQRRKPNNRHLAKKIERQTNE